MNKPVGLLSHDVVARVRRAVGESKVGHAGTLDPLASGALIIGVGQATRLLGLITLDDKRYVARIAFGCETATDDAEGEPIRTAPVPSELLDETFARSVLASIVGEQDQVPPAYSAISVNGRRAYDIARKGGDVELTARRITVHDALLVSIEHSDDAVVWTCAFHVSKGTYIRSLARDLGRKLGSAAHLSGLVRTASGSVPLDRCIELDTLAEGGLDAALSHMLDPLELLPYPWCVLSVPEATDIIQGKQISSSVCSDLAIGERVCLTFDGKLISVGECTGPRILVVSNFPEGIEGVRR